MNSSQPLAHRVALVTGASRGIGRAIAVAFARAGADVALNYATREDAAREVCAEIGALGRSAIILRADVSRASEVAELIDETEAALGPVDILVNNAGIAEPSSLLELSEEDWDRTMDINLKSAFLVTKAVLGGMVERGFGRIINVSSVAAQVGGAVGPHYAASKAGMLGLTRWVARNHVKQGVTCNAIAPALIETDMVTTNLNASPDLIPMGHFGNVNDVASVSVMLATNNYMTGQTISVNGGWYLT